MVQGLKTLLVIAGLGLALYASLLGLLWWGQEKLLFHPQPLPAHHRFSVDPDVQETWIDVPGARLNALHLRLPQPQGVVFFLHGNAGNLDSWFTDLEFYRRANVDLFMLDYRGYGKSTGRIQSQEQLLADVRAAWAQVEPHYVGKRRVIYGRSLGSGLAAMLAAEVQPELTVLVSPYFSMAELAREHYPWVPGTLLRYPLATHEALARIRGPVLLAHGGRDTLIPPAHSQRLHQVAPHASLLHLPEGGHNDLHLLPAYVQGMSAALKR
jgi:hypothetical protein